MRFRRALRDDRGATAVEYGLIAALIAVVILVAVVLLGGNLSSLFRGAASSLTGSSQTGGGGTTPQPLGAGAPGPGTCTSGDKSGTYGCTMSVPASIDGVSVSYAFECDGDCGSRVTWSPPTLSLSGWGSGRNATVVVEWGFTGSANFQASTGTIELNFE